MSAKFWIVSLVCLLPWQAFAQHSLPGPHQAMLTQNRIDKISNELVALARTEVRLGRYKRFLLDQGSIPETLPNSFVFDHPPPGTQGQIQQVYWNEPEGLFALVNLGTQHQVLPGHLMRYSKDYPGHEALEGGVLMILQPYEQQSYALILQATRVPAVNDPIE